MMAVWIVSKRWRRILRILGEINSDMWNFSESAQRDESGTVTTGKEKTAPRSRESMAMVTHVHFLTELDGVIISEGFN